MSERTHDTIKARVKAWLADGGDETDAASVAVLLRGCFGGGPRAHRSVVGRWTVTGFGGIIVERDPLGGMFWQRLSGATMGDWHSTLLAALLALADAGVVVREETAAETFGAVAEMLDGDQVDPKAILRERAEERADDESACPCGLPLNAAGACSGGTLCVDYAEACAVQVETYTVPALPINPDDDRIVEALFAERCPTGPVRKVYEDGQGPECERLRHELDAARNPTPDAHGRIAGCRIAPPEEWQLSTNARGHLVAPGLRDVILRMGELLHDEGRVEPPIVLLRRAASLWEASVRADPVMAGFLGRGGIASDRDPLLGSGSLDDLAEDVATDFATVTAERDGLRLKLAGSQTLCHFADHSQFCAVKCESGPCDCGYGAARAAVEVKP